jgi:hypothetical protein
MKRGIKNKNAPMNIPFTTTFKIDFVMFLNCVFVIKKCVVKMDDEASFILLYFFAIYFHYFLNTSHSGSSKSVKCCCRKLFYAIYQKQKSHQQLSDGFRNYLEQRCFHFCRKAARSSSVIFIKLSCMLFLLAKEGPLPLIPLNLNPPKRMRQRRSSPIACQ